MKAIAEAKIKTDDIDSETLTHLLRVRPAAGVIRAFQGDQGPPELVKRRAFLIGMRTRLNNRIHAELAKRDIDPGTPLFTKQGRAL